LESRPADEADYELPEISGSAFFTYGFAYGINSGILDGKIYRPVVRRAWKGLLAIFIRTAGWAACRLWAQRPVHLLQPPAMLWHRRILAGWLRVYRLAH